MMAFTLTVLVVHLTTISAEISAPSITSSNGRINPAAGIQIKGNADIEDLLYNHQWKQATPLTKLRRILFHHQMEQRTMQHTQKHGTSIMSSRDRMQSNCRTRLMFSLPTPQQLFNIMFASYIDDMPSANADSAIRRKSRNMLQFNHDSVGMTKPQQSSAGPSSPSSSQPLSILTTKNTYSMNIDSDESNNLYQIQNTSVKSKANIGDNKQDQPESLWWPSTSMQNGDQKWRVKRYIRRVGAGRECYNLVRDAALDWEFKSFDHDHDDKMKKTNQVLEQASPMSPLTGIIRAMPPPRSYSLPSSSSMAISENTNPNILQLFEGVGSGPNCSANAHRKLATFIRYNLNIPRPQFMNRLKLRFPISISLPTLYAVNPVAVVYDVVDERGDYKGKGGDGFANSITAHRHTNGEQGATRHYGCTYSSTAYATLKGHLLSGEERVSVILRHDADEGLGPRQSNILETSRGVHGSRKDGYVDVEIVSFSKAAPSILGKLIWPFIAKKQDEFFQSEMNALERVAKSCKE